MKLPILLIFLLDLLIVLNAKQLILKKPECTSKRLKDIDKIFLKLETFGPEGRKLPASMNDLPDSCKEINRNLDIAGKFFDECLSQDDQRLFKIILFSAKKNMKPLCGKKRNMKKLAKLLDVAGCVNTFLNDFTCLSKLSNDTYELIPYKIGKEKINYACCNFVNAMKCADIELSKKSCMTDSGKELALDNIRALTGDLVNFACGEYNESTDRCETIPKLPKDKFDKNYKFDKKLKSLAFAHFQLLESMGGFSVVD